MTFNIFKYYTHYILYDKERPCVSALTIIAFYNQNLGNRQKYAHLHKIHYILAGNYLNLEQVKNMPCVLSYTYYTETQ